MHFLQLPRLRHRITKALSVLKKNCSCGCLDCLKPLACVKEPPKRFIEGALLKRKQVCIFLPAKGLHIGPDGIFIGAISILHLIS